MAKINLRDANEVDVIIDCPCGTSFYVYLPKTPYKCPDCSRMYEVSLSAKLLKINKKNWNLVGQKINE